MRASNVSALANDRGERVFACSPGFSRNVVMMGVLPPEGGTTCASGVARAPVAPHLISSQLPIKFKFLHRFF